MTHEREPLRAAPEPERRTAPNRATRIFLWVFSLAMIVTAGTAFLMKLADFYVTATTEGAGALASFLIPVLNYLFVAGGFAFLFLWALSRGQFKDVEEPKYRMLQRNLELDREWEREMLARRTRS